MSTKIIDAEPDVAAQAARLIAEHGTHRVTTLSGGRGLQFLLTVDDYPAPDPAPTKPAAKKTTPTKPAATPAATES